MPPTPAHPPPHGWWFVPSGPPHRANARLAAPSVDRWDLAIQVEGHAAIGAPYGMLGVALGVDLARYVGFVAGGGMGASGLQIAAGARGRVPLTWVAFGLEVTWSGGPYEHDKCHFLCLDDRPVDKWPFAHWLNLAPGVEFRAEGGFSARIYGGYAALLNPADGRCDSTCRAAEIGFFGTAFGAAF